MIALIRIELDENHLAKETNEIYDRLQGYNSVLMPIPEKIEMVDDWRVNDLKKAQTGLMARCYFKGYNACIDEITGENE